MTTELQKKMMIHLVKSYLLQTAQIKTAIKT